MLQRVCSPNWPHLSHTVNRVFWAVLVVVAALACEQASEPGGDPTAAIPQPAPALSPVAPPTVLSPVTAIAPTATPVAPAQATTATETAPTAIPTGALIPTEVPTPTLVPTPTSTPTPTASPTPTPTPTPSPTPTVVEKDDFGNRITVNLL